VGALIQGDLVRSATNAESIDLGFYTANNGFGSLSEKFKIKGNGAFVVNGNMGGTKQVLMSSGSNTPPAWTSMGNILQVIATPTSSYIDLPGISYVDIPSATLSITVTVPSRVLVYSLVTTSKGCIIGACHTKWELTVYLNGQIYVGYGVDGVRYADSNQPSLDSDATLGPAILDLAPGIHNITFKGRNIFNEPFINLSSIAMVIPQ